MNKQQNAGSKLEEGKTGREKPDVFRCLAQDILTGKLKPGERLKELELAKRFGVSRTPVREALLRLEQDGWARREPNKGFEVPVLTTEEVRERYPIMWGLEAFALKLSWSLVESVVKDLYKINDEFLACSHHPLKAIEVDARWHQTLVSRCTNRRLLEIIEENRTILKRYEYIGTMKYPLLVTSVRQHDRIIDAIRANDLADAVAGLEANWLSGLECLLLNHASYES